MSLEIGGRSDKYGNEYENQYLVRLLLRLVSGKYKSIIVEPLGENKDAVEYIATDKNDNNWHYQCKASNTTHPKWSIYDLSKYDVPKRARTIINAAPDNHYVFISPLTYGELPELCKRAQTNSSVEEFKTYQLNNGKIKATFNDFAKYGNFDKNDDEQYSELVKVLSKSHFETVPSGHENILDLNEHVSFFFTGNSDAARSLLQNYVNTTGKFGVILTANDIISYMEQSGFPMRSSIHNDNISVRVNELNNSFYQVFQPINQKLIHRAETEQIINEITLGNSVVLHGKAGTGKSGCVQEVIQELQNKSILYLALKLDKFIPETTADNYGRELGLQQSPVYCLHNLSAGKPCVILLDQLDSLRWTNHHSANALGVCKELISQVRMLNEYHNGHISIIFVSRTFDLENDTGLRSLLSPKENDPISWTKIQINVFTHKEVETLIGSEYNRLSTKLKNLLLTPSSLYIWTLLDDHTKVQSIDTPFELVEYWWKQINDKSSAAGLIVGRVTSVKDDIVRKMENTSLLSLPESMFVDYNNEIEYLASSGLLIKGNNKIAFTHQSFLDFFAVFKKIKEIFEGRSIIEIIGEKNKQTPHLRYRILRILQNILETDEDFFVNMCEEILSSESVRHYFKCTVFEVCGQFANPNSTLLNYTHKYYIDPKWHDYVYNTVYLGHSQYILDLDKHGSYDWLSSEGLALLRSINTDSPDFVLKKIKPICFISKENDIIAYNTLSHDCAQDSPEMLELRLKLFESNPDFLENFWGISNLIKSNSENLIPILKLIVKRSDDLKRHIYFGDVKELNNYAKKHYHKIIKEILPVVCDATKKFQPQWPSHDWSQEYRNWTRESYNEHSARDIVRILKFAMCEFSAQEPEEFISFVNNYNGIKSVIYYEIISTAINSLDKIYSDFAISWLYKDVMNHLFIYTGNQEDYLSLSKKIIKKFSPFCSEFVLSELETLILNWKEPIERMVYIYKRRIEVNKEKNWQPVYYAFWGHLQKELLPFIDENRLSTNAKALLGVLKRNEWIRTPFYYCGFLSGGAKSVVSPIHGKTEIITDKKWLEIISTPNEKMNEHFSSKETSAYYIEANHMSFSSAMSVQAKKEPTRFALLALRFPENCYSGYITSAINALYDYDVNIGKIDFKIMCDIINHFKNHNNHNVIISILRLIEKNSKEKWPTEIIDFVCDVAINSQNPSPEQHAFSDSDSSEVLTPHSLLNNAINCVRGCAMETISKLLWEHSEYGETFKPIIEKACEDKNDAVLFSVMFCVFPYYQIDKDFCVETFKKLILKDIRVLAFHGAWQIISRDYDTNGPFYSQYLFEACNSNIEELNETSAGLLCAAGIFYDNDLLDELLKKELTDKQINSICNQAISSFNQEEFHEKSQEVLLNYIETDNYEINSFGRLFFDRCIDIERDEDFLIKLMNSKQKPYQIHSFLDYISELDDDITSYVNVIKSICENVLLNGDSWDNEMITEDLIKCIIKIFDSKRSTPEIQSLCLDMWDDLYQRCLKSIKPFVEIFDNIN